jgi:small subunit ribosomal protein S8
MTNDLVSDMLTRIRNASMARHSFTSIRYSNLNLGILKVLKSEGYIQDFYLENETKPSQTSIKVILKYKGWWIKKPFFSVIQRISKPGKRVFSGYKNFGTNIDILRHQQGVAIISTSSGVMGHLKATKLKKGGEILCYIG